MVQMDDHQPTYDSLLAGAFGPSLLVDPQTDQILATSDEVAELLGKADVIGARFSNCIASDHSQFLVFVEEVLYRGEAWTRSISLKAGAQDEFSILLTSTRWNTAQNWRQRHRFMGAVCWNGSAHKPFLPN